MVVFRIRMPKSPNGLIWSHILEAKNVVGCESHFSALKRVLNFQSTRLIPRNSYEKLIAVQMLGLDWISSIFINRIIWLILIELQFVVLVNSIFNRFSNRSNQVFSFRVFSGFRVGLFRVRVFSGSGSGRVGLRFWTRLRPLVFLQSQLGQRRRVIKWYDFQCKFLK